LSLWPLESPFEAPLAMGLVDAIVVNPLGRVSCRDGREYGES
jgi:hypothetical protein